MWQQFETGHDHVVGLRYSAELTAVDLRATRNLLEDRARATSRLAVVVLLEDFRGYGSWNALLGDLRLGADMEGDVRRVAVVSDRSWLGWAAELGGLVSGIELGSFATEDLTEAIAWAAPDAPAVQA